MFYPTRRQSGQMAITLRIEKHFTAGDLVILIRDWAHRNNGIESIESITSPKKLERLIRAEARAPYFNPEDESENPLDEEFEISATRTLAKYLPAIMLADEKRHKTAEEIKRAERIEMEQAKYQRWAQFERDVKDQVNIQSGINAFAVHAIVNKYSGLIANGYDRKESAADVARQIIEHHRRAGKNGE